MNQSARKYWWLAVVAASVALTVFSLSQFVLEPWNVVPNVGGDGAKNILTYLYHSAYGKGYWFQGMNYPYGEHIVFTDGFPLLSVFFASTGNVSFSVALTAMWWLIAFSYVLSAICLYMLLRRITGTHGYSLLCALLINFITPQFLRLQGHYALSLVNFIPMFFYWTYMYHATSRYRYCAYMFAAGSVAAFIHPYYAGMLLVWCVLYGIGYFISVRPPLVKGLKHAAAVIGVSVAVAAMVMVVMKITDPLTDRPASPHDGSESNANVPQVISSYYSPIWRRLVDKEIVPVVADGGEGFSYPGLIPLGVLFVAGIMFVVRRIKKTQPAGTSVSRDMRLWLVVGLGALIFSMGIPFIWHMEWLKDYLPLFRQFRALGRFAWIFYYTVAAWAAVVMLGWFRQLQAAGRGRLAWALMVPALLVWGYEATGYMRATRKIAYTSVYHHEIMLMTREKTWGEFLAEHNMKGGDFQALLLLKFFHVGSEKIWVGDPGWLMTLGARAALALHLPIVDVMMSRSSWAQAQAQVKIVAGPYAGKPILNDIKTDKPFLLLKLNDDSLNIDEKYLLQAADYLGEFSTCQVYACYPRRIAAADKKHRDELEAMLPGINDDTCIGCQTAWAIEHYDGGAERMAIAGAGSAPVIATKDSVFYEMDMAPLADSVLYEYSGWFLLSRADYKSPEVKVELLAGDGSVLSVTKAECKQSTDSYGMWFRNSAYFYVPQTCARVRLRLINDKPPNYIAMDELLLRPAAGLVVSKGRDGIVMVNGHVFKKSE